MEDLEVESSPERQLHGTDATNGIIWKCVVESSTELHAIFTVFVESFQLHSSVTINTLPNSNQISMKSLLHRTLFWTVEY